MATPKKPPPNSPDAKAKTTPPATSKPVIVTHRPILKDSQATDNASEPTKAAAKPDLTHTTGTTVKPLEQPATNTPAEQPATKETESPKPEPPQKEVIEEPAPQPQAEEKPAEKPAPQPAPQPPAPPEPSPKPETAGTKDTKEPKSADDQAEKQRAAAIDRLIESGKYVLPINAVEKRKAKHFMILGIFLAILLVLAWGDIAADAGLIHINGVKPVTHFFSN